MNGASSSAEVARTEAMMEGTRMLIDSLREKVAALEDRCEKMDREKVRTFPISVRAASVECFSAGINVFFCELGAYPWFHNVVEESGGY